MGGSGEEHFCSGTLVEACSRKVESEHHLITARIVRAFAKASHWNGKQFGSSSSAAPCLSFYGSQAFAVVQPATQPAEPLPEKDVSETVGDVELISI